MTVEELVKVLDREVTFEVLQAYDREILFESSEYDDKHNYKRWEEVKIKLSMNFIRQIQENYSYLFIQVSCKLKKNVNKIEIYL